MHWFELRVALLTVSMTAACANARHTDAMATSDSGVATVQASDDAGAMPVASATQDAATGGGAVVHRSCGRPNFGPEWSIDSAAPGITCRSHSDCGSRPLGHCIGLPDCFATDANGCTITPLRTTFCLYDQCANDGDCAAGSQCVCPHTGGDPWCVVDGCDDDSDCVSGQRCRSDESVQGVGPPQHCTTPADVCVAASDCARPNEACGYDQAAHHWSCRTILIVD